MLQLGGRIRRGIALLALASSISGCLSYRFGASEPKPKVYVAITAAELAGAAGLAFAGAKEDGYPAAFGYSLAGFVVIDALIALIITKT